MPRLEIPIFGSSNQDAIDTVSNQRTVNFIPNIDAGSDKKVSLLGFPGAVSFSALSASGRGIFCSAGSLYVISGTTLYKISDTGVQASIGTVPGTGQAVFAQGEGRFHIVADGKVYKVVADVLTDITDADLETPNSVTWLNGYFIYDGDNGRFWVSEINDPDSIDPLDFATAERRSDDLLRVYAHGSQVWMLGTQSTEIWYPSGASTPPFSPHQNILHDIGIISPYAIAGNERELFFIGSDRRPYLSKGLAMVNVGTPQVSREWDTYDVDNAICFAIEWDGRNSFCVRFPNQGKTWQYWPDINVWIELEYGNLGAGMPVSGYSYCYGKRLIQNPTTGTVYELSDTAYDFDGTDLISQRDTAYVRSDLIGDSRKRVFYNKIELLVDAGVGLVSGQGSDPKIMLQYSDDSGHTWSTERWKSFGKLGEFNYRTEWSSLGSSYNRQFRIKISDPVKHTLVAMYADVDIGAN